MLKGINLGKAMLFVCACALMMFSCKKEEIIDIPDNVAPPDRTVENITIESYINKSYINLLGRKPDDAEFSAAYGPLRTANFSRDSRKTFVDGLTVTTEYDQRIYAVGRAFLLNAADTTDIRQQRDLFDLLLTQQQFQAYWPQITIERDRLNEVLAIPADFASNSINIREMHRRLIYNYFYDQINMGTQNFVISMFQNFMLRYPTSEELSSGSQMVDGFASTFFLENGRTKEDFIRIFFESSDYYEGQVRDLYLRTHFREPTTEEIEDLVIPYKSSGNYEALLRDIMTTDEYSGI